MDTNNILLQEANYFLARDTIQTITAITINTRKNAHHIPALKISPTTEQPVIKGSRPHIKRY
jgi:hypothetical protein